MSDSLRSKRLEVLGAKERARERETHESDGNLISYLLFIRLSSVEMQYTLHLN